MSKYIGLTHTEHEWAKMDDFIAIVSDSQEPSSRTDLRFNRHKIDVVSVGKYSFLLRTEHGSVMSSVSVVWFGFGSGIHLETPFDVPLKSMAHRFAFIVFF